MNKPFIITFSVCTIIFATTAVIMLMMLLPKQLVSLKTSVETYQQIEKANYTYTETKAISKEALRKEYKITNDNILEFKRKYQYVAGNSDPFYRPSENTGTNEQNNNTSTGGTASGSQTAVDKTTNSNGGIKNPESTNK